MFEDLPFHSKTVIMAKLYLSKFGCQAFFGIIHHGFQDQTCSLATFEINNVCTKISTFLKQLKSGQYIKIPFRNLICASQFRNVIILFQ